MPRLEQHTAQFFATLSTQLKQENVSPEQVGALSRAIATLPENARLTSTEVDALSKNMRLTDPHKATLIFALLLHRYPALRTELKEPNAWSNHVAGVLDALVAKAGQNDGGVVALALDAFFVSFAGPRAAVENSGVELFKGAPAIAVEKGTERVVVSMHDSVYASLEATLRVALQLPAQNNRGQAPFGQFVTGGEGGWVFRPEKREGKQPDDIALGRLGVQALEHLAQGISTYIGTRSSGQQNVKETEAMAIASDVGVAGTLLSEVMRLKTKKNSELGVERSQREQELRKALGNYRVERIGAETVNALVGALFPEKKA